MSSCTCHSLSKVAERQAYIEKKKQQRRENTSKKRQDQFITDYVYHKYGAIYNEAAQFYNILNQRYPKKYDLRKNEEYRKWKRQVTGQPEKITTQKYHLPSHPFIQNSIAIHPESILTVVYDEQESTHENPEQNETVADENPEQNETVADENPEQNETVADENPEQNETVADENPEQKETVADENPEQNETVADENPEQNETDSDEDQKTVYVDNMQLKIPLLELTKKPNVTTETLQTVTEEILQEGDQIEPSLYDEIDQEVIEKIIAELCNEPELQDVFSSIEQQLEIEQVGMEIDIAEDTRLEDELENLMLW